MNNVKNKEIPIIREPRNIGKMLNEYSYVEFESWNPLKTRIYFADPGLKKEIRPGDIFNVKKDFFVNCIDGSLVVAKVKLWND